jgi:hypothetical protein
MENHTKIMNGPGPARPSRRLPMLKDCAPEYPVTNQKLVMEEIFSSISETMATALGM